MEAKPFINKNYKTLQAYEAKVSAALSAEQQRKLGQLSLKVAESDDAIHFPDVPERKPTDFIWVVGRGERFNPRAVCLLENAGRSGAVHRDCIKRKP